MNPLQEAFLTGVFFGAFIMVICWIAFNIIQWLI